MSENGFMAMIKKNPVTTGIVSFAVLSVLIIIIVLVRRKNNTTPKPTTKEGFSFSDTFALSNMTDEDADHIGLGYQNEENGYDYENNYENEIVENFPQPAPMNVMYSDANGNLATTTDLGLQNLTVTGDSQFANNNVLINSGDLGGPGAQTRINAQGIIFGGTNKGREVNSAQISAGRHAEDSLCIVGMSSDDKPKNRRIHMWAEAGTTHNGPITLNNRINFIATSGAKGIILDSSDTHLRFRDGKDNQKFVVHSGELPQWSGTGISIGKWVPDTNSSINADKNINTDANISAGGALSAGSISTGGALSAGSISTGGALSAGSIGTGSVNIYNYGDVKTKIEDLSTKIDALTARLDDINPGKGQLRANDRIFLAENHQLSAHRHWIRGSCGDVWGSSYADWQVC